jgi:hypothetical protein
MKFSTPKLGLTLAAMLAAGLCALPAAAQTTAPAAASAPSAEAAPGPAMQPQPARPIPRKRRAAMPAAMTCEAVKDPWENVCTIRKHAEIACSDLPAPAAKAARKARKGAPPPADVRNPRQECVDAYMRNV